jgi:hypothetical protein
MSRAAKRKSQRTNDAMTTEQLVRKATEDVKRMSPDEKAKLRARLTREFGPACIAKKVGGLAEAARRCAAEEAAMSDYGAKGKPVN